MIYTPRNEFCIIWVIFLMPTDQVMTFLCFISDSQLVDMSGQGLGGGWATVPRVLCIFESADILAGSLKLRRKTFNPASLSSAKTKNLASLSQI